HQSLDYRTPAEEHFVLCSKPAASIWMHLILPVSWSKHWDPPHLAQGQSMNRKMGFGITVVLTIVVVLGALQLRAKRG
ncbi:MAG: hypothetical protein OXJ55_15670, partial [Caldilineaceae bacterium]|nr:hypothetical protein [Caldilineaceae bacterium]